MPRSFVATTLHSDLKYGDLKMICKCDDNLNIPDFHRNLDMRPFYDALYYIKVSNLHKVLISNSKFTMRNTPLWTRHKLLCLTSLRNYLAVLIRLPK